MASNKKKPADQKPEDEVIDGQEQANDEVPEGDEQNAEAGAQDEVTANPDEPEEVIANPDEPEEVIASHKVTVKLDADEVIKAIHHHITSMGDLHARIEKAVKSLSPHAGQEKAFALHQLELLTGRLKMAIPAAIAATDDAELRTGLNTLLGIL